eukprot:CAMPEP_0119310098 /NCGR_PEP_ID=MMETSP1333-20130426/17699_1 /TAXON_ID=418940 /ORGANISM="Scyphosphaera apsteinii, Strain RCC1455" /LENGTH=222 /DNA_ID=CAMNT_0007314215 /DNA_START=254 /DNA_END=919 /DNA_ORIENTATION=+
MGITHAMIGAPDPLKGFRVLWEMQDPLEIGFAILPVTAFSLLLFSEVMTWLFTLIGPHVVFGYMRHSVMAVHAMSTVYYIMEPACGALGIVDTFGRPLYPLRYALWMCSVSCMCISLYFVLDNLLLERRAAREALHQLLSSALLLVFGTFLLGFLATKPWPGAAGTPAMYASFSLYALSAGLFSLMMRRVVGMLHLLSHVFKKRSSILVQFRIIRYAILITW